MKKTRDTSSAPSAEDTPVGLASEELGNETRKTMASATSFTGASGVRYPAPDVARGMMLLLIAVANVTTWIHLFPEKAEDTFVDQVWILVRGLFVTHRAYPLFAMLFGFGLMTMIQRRLNSHVQARTQTLDERAPGLDPASRQQWLAGFDREGREQARKLVRRRGWWMLLFAFVHGLLFYGDIIGTYALVAIVFAGAFSAYRWRTFVSVSAAVSVPLIIIMLGGASWQVYTLGVEAATAGSASDFLVTWFYPFVSLAFWVTGTVATFAFSLVLPAAFIGVWLASTDFLSHPEKHRPVLWALAAVGLLLGALGSAPMALYTAHFISDLPVWAYAVAELSGLLGAIGWLAFLTVIAGPAVETIRGWRKLFSVVGTRSMTAYISQSVLFALIFGIAGLAVGVRAVPQWVGLAVAVGVWVFTVVMCLIMESSGYVRGPLEVLLRRAVANSAKPVSFTEIPQIPAPQAVPPAQ